LLFSLTGGSLAMLVMALCRKIPFLSIYGVSILGAAAHNIGQICASMLIMHSVYIGAYLPYLLAIAIVTGIATGAAGAGVLRVLTRPDAPFMKGLK
ncbi:MAG: Gx transporter family protein, partial [Clostridia bacterium]|nr:Gx transporter family protein [Clostridia bacterium]